MIAALRPVTFTVDVLAISIAQPASEGTDDLRLEAVAQKAAPGSSEWLQDAVTFVVSRSVTPPGGVQLTDSGCGPLPVR